MTPDMTHLVLCFEDQLKPQISESIKQMLYNLILHERAPTAQRAIALLTLSLYLMQWAHVKFSSCTISKQYQLQKRKHQAALSQKLCAYMLEPNLRYFLQYASKIYSK